jgi:hypothetical protein
MVGTLRFAHPTKLAVNPIIFCIPPLMGFAALNQSYARLCRRMRKRNLRPGAGVKFEGG